MVVNRVLVQTLAKQNINLFLECLKEEQGEVKVILQTVFDVGVTFGMAHFNSDDNVNPSLPLLVLIDCVSSPSSF